MITIKQARPRASPHWRLRCWVFPAIWSGLPWAPWKTPSKGFKGLHWARYCHHTENPMQVTEAPVSTRPRTGMPSRLSWLVMGGPTAQPTRVTLASGDPSNSLTVRWGELGSCSWVAAAPVFVLEAVHERWRALADRGGAGELDGPGSWRRSVLPLRRGSSVAVVDPCVGEEGGRTEDLHCTPGRGGERARQREEAVERLQR